jgi:hypothetical protein
MASIYIEAVFVFAAVFWWGVWDWDGIGIGDISVAAVMAAGGCALTAPHFSRRRKVSKRLRPGVRRLAEAPRSLATVPIRGHRLRSASRRPPLDVCGCAARRYAPNPLMNTYARPAEGAKDQKQIKIKSQSQSQSQSQSSRREACAHPKRTRRLQSLLRRQASSHRGRCTSAGDWSTVRPPSLAGQLPQGRCTSAGDWSTVRPPSLAGQLPQGRCTSAGDWSTVRPPSLAGQLPQGRCTSAGDWSTVRPPSLAGQLPQGRCTSAGDWSAVRPPSLAGQLPQGRCTSAGDWSAVRPPSLAGQLPQGLVYICKRLVGWRAAIAGRPTPTINHGVPPAPHHSTGRAVARLQLLILIHPPLREAECRRSSGGQARSAVRRSRTHREEVEAKPTGGDAPR